MPDAVHLHLISDSTGETTHGVTRACLAQFEDVEVEEHLWPFVRSRNQLELVMEAIRKEPGPVIFSLVNQRMKTELQMQCVALKVPCISVLDPVIEGLGGYFGREMRGLPGGQHQLTTEYFSRIEAMNYAHAHDDGQSTYDLADSDVILVGVSRTSKTPTSMYLANHFGIKTANIPVVPNIELPPKLFEIDGPFIVGLTSSPERLVQIRRNRLLMLRQQDETDYIDIETVEREVMAARKLFLKHGWPVIDVTRRSIEETAAAIFQLYNKHRERLTQTVGADSEAT